MEALNLTGWVAVRLGVGYVYLFALYMNTRDAASRQWLLEHTAYIFPNTPEPGRTHLSKYFSIVGMLMMLLGGLSVVIGLEGRIGALLLLSFTLGGIYQHKREREVALALGQHLEPLVAQSDKADLMTLQWSAFSGHFSSALKNWALCAMCVGIVAWGTGPLTISDRILNWILR